MKVHSHAYETSVVFHIKKVQTFEHCINMLCIDINWFSNDELKIQVFPDDLHCHLIGMTQHSNFPSNLSDFVL